MEKLIEKWRASALECREEAGRIRRTIKAPTDAEERAEMWEKCAADLEAILSTHND